MYEEYRGEIYEHVHKYIFKLSPTLDYMINRISVVTFYY